MSLNVLFHIGRSAVFSSQRALSVTSHNIANVNTLGYSRQEIVLSVSAPVQARGGMMGTGVSVGGIRRSYDQFIESQLMGQNQSHGRSVSLEKVYSRIEQVFNENGEMGLSRALGDFFAAWQDLSTNPEGQTQRLALLQKANLFAQRAKRMEQELLANLKEVNREIADVAGSVNVLAEEIAGLNRQIAQTEGQPNAETANDLRDRRTALVNELSGLAEVSTYEGQDGAVNVTVGMRNLVYGGTAKAITAKSDADGNRTLSLDGINITGDLARGRLGGLLSARSDLESGPLLGLRRMVAALTKEMNLLHAAGYGLDGSTGNAFFNPLQLSARDYSSGADATSMSITDLSQLTLDEYEIKIDAANNYLVYNAQSGALVTSGSYVSGAAISFDGISVTLAGAVSANDRFVISPLGDAIGNLGVALTDTKQIAAASSPAGLPGDNGNAVLIAGLADSALSSLGNATFGGYYGSLVSYVGTASRAAADSLAFDERLRDEMSARREAISGVSLDEEAANLIRYQRAFEAGARLITITNELMETILKL